MKYTIVTLLIVLISLLVGAACDRAAPNTISQVEEVLIEKDAVMNDSLKVTVGEKVFTAILFENASAREFRTMLPLTIDMIELNGNEKYFRFSRNLPTDESEPEKIHSGDLMLWGSNTLVLFYETFPTSYSYTKLGKIDNTTGLAEAVGAGRVTVTFELH